MYSVTTAECRSYLLLTLGIYNIPNILPFRIRRVCERSKLRVNVGKSKVMRCSSYGNGDRMHVILNGEPLEEMDYIK